MVSCEGDAVWKPASLLEPRLVILRKIGDGIGIIRARKDTDTDPSPHITPSAFEHRLMLVYDRTRPVLT